MKTKLALAFVLFAPFASAQLQSQQTIHPLFERELPNESDLQTRIRDGILGVQSSVSALNGGRKLRGTHAKGICARAEFEILAQLPSVDHQQASRLQRGIFSHPGIYPATIRFANAASTVESDQTPDVRAASLAVQLPTEISNESGRIDFAMNNAATFPINDAGVFADLMLYLQLGRNARRFVETAGTTRFAKVIGAYALGELQKTVPETAFQTTRFWSGVPFTLGGDSAVKYSLKPCSDNPTQALSVDPNALMTELRRHVSEDDRMSCFEFQVQPLRADVMTSWGRHQEAWWWVENATALWKESQAPFYTIARVTLVRGSVLSESECDALRIDPAGHTTPDHRGLGSINRARGYAERASATARQRQ